MDKKVLVISSEFNASPNKNVIISIKVIKLNCTKYAMTFISLP